MKFKSLSILICLVLSLMTSANAQSSFTSRKGSPKNISYKATNASGVRIVGLDITEDYLSLVIDLTRCKGALEISDKAYITPGNGSKKFYVLAEESDAVFNRYSNSQNVIMLYFPNLYNELKDAPSTIHFRSNADDKGLNIFDIKISSEAMPKSQVSYTLDSEGNKVKVVKNPAYAAKTGGIEIIMIELSEKETVLTFKARGKVWIPSSSCINVSNTKETMAVVKAEGIALDAHVNADTIPQYKLYFPSVPKDTKLLNFKEPKGTWAFYEMELDEK